MAPLEERTEYPYQNIRSKNYPWGDGDKVRARPFCFYADKCMYKSLTLSSQTIL